MALKRATKSIPLSGGESDEIAEFLLEPPGMAYVQNGRFRKLDALEKTEPVTSIGSSGITGFTNDPIVAWARGDQLVTAGGSEISKYDGSSWTVETVATDIYGIEKLLSTAEVEGGSNFTWAPLGDYDAGASPNPQWDIDAYVVAFEQAYINNSSEVVEKSTVVQVYRSSGELLREDTITDKNTPRLVPKDNLVQLMVTRNGGQFDLYDITLASTTLNSSAARNVYPYHQQYSTATVSWNGEKWEDMRAGFSRLTQRRNGAVAYFDRPWLSTGVFAWKRTSGTFPGIDWQLTGGGPVHTLVEDILSSTARFKLLDCAADATNVYFLVTVSNTTTPNPNSSLYLYRRAHDNTAQVLKILNTAQDGTYVNGSLSVASDGDCYAAATFSAGYVTDNLNTGEDNRVRWYELDDNWSTISQQGNIYNHKVCSNVEVDDQGVGHVVVQQWSNWNPDSNTFGGSPEVPVTVPTLKKPVTSLLVKLVELPSPGEKNLVVSSFDPGQSKHMDASFEEQDIHLGNLYFLNDIQQSASENRVKTWLYGNRNILVSEDYFYYLTAPGGGAAFPADESRLPLHLGTARMNLFQCRPGAPVFDATIDPGFITSTALPLWYDGAVLGEASVLDQPEIVRIEANGDGNSYTAYDPLLTAGEQPKVIAVVVGFFDDSGLAHRSAPSVPVYSGNLDASNSAWTTATMYTVTVTPPLSVFRDRSYFVEVYEALLGEPLQLAATKTGIPGDASGKVEVTVKTNVLSAGGVPEGNVGRSSKILYTEGNVLPSDPWPNFDFLARTSQRVFAHSITAPGTVYYSKIFEEGVAPEFSAALVLSLGPVNITAMGALDDKIVAFEKGTAHVIYGTGPDNTGANGDFLIERLEIVVGCEDPQSVVETPDGLMFYSSVSQEFHLITRDLQLIDIGKPVQDLSDNFNIVCADVYPLEHEVRFYGEGSGTSDWGPSPDTGVGIPDRPPRPRYGRSLPASPVMVYNYHYKKWTVLSGQPAKKVTLYQNKPAYIDDSWEGFVVDDTWSNSQRVWVETPWIKVNQLQDFGRFFEATFVGKYLSSWADNGTGLEAGDLRVSVKYDYEGLGGAGDVFLFRANADFDPSAGERLQFSVKPSRQKCQAVKFIIDELATVPIELSEPTYANGRGFELISVDLHYGAKGGSSRLGSKRKK